MPEQKKYEIILADPAWSYDVWSKKGIGRNAENHYPTMSIEDICALPIANITAKNSTLFLWVTFPKLQEVFRVIEAWGYKFRTVTFVWVKRNKKVNSWFMGLGYWTQANAEICLLATKGKPKRISKSIRQIIDAPIEQHSKKPDETRQRIVELIGDLPRIELFAHQKVDGWDSWGNEIECDIELQINNKNRSDL